MALITSDCDCHRGPQEAMANHVKFTGSAGDVLLFDTACWHTGMPNTSSRGAPNLNARKVSSIGFHVETGRVSALQKCQRNPSNAATQPLGPAAEDEENKLWLATCTGTAR